MRRESPAALLAVAAGLCALVPLGGSLAWMADLALVLVAIAPWARPWTARAPWWALTIPNILAAAIGVALFEPQGPVAALLIYLAVQRRLARESLDDDRASVGIAALMLALAGLYTTSPWFVGALLAFLAGGVATLSPAGVTRRTWALAALAVVAAGPLYVMIPRGSSPKGPDPVFAMVSRTGRDIVTLGDADVLIMDHTPLVWVTLPDGVEGPIYLRGSTAEYFDGVGWAAGPRPDDLGEPPESTIDVMIQQEAMADRAVFTTGDVQSVDIDDVERVGGGALQLRGDPLPLLVIVHTSPPLGQGGVVAHDPPWEADLQLPDLDPRVQALSDELAGGAQGEQAVIDAIASGLRSGWSWTESPRDADREDPLTVFLFERREGHCEYFASALTVLLRLQGIPARVVEGFAGGADEGDGRIVFRGRDAHAWVEAWVPERGWVIADATPPRTRFTAPPPVPIGERISRAWDSMVVSYDHHAQADLFAAAATPTRLAPAAAAGAGLAAIALAVRLYRRLPRRAARSRVVAAWERARQALLQLGYPLPANLPPEAAARRVRALAGAEADPVLELARMVNRVRWGGADDSALAAEADRLAALAVLLPPRLT